MAKTKKVASTTETKKRGAQKKIGFKFHKIRDGKLTSKDYRTIREFADDHECSYARARNYVSRGVDKDGRFHGCAIEKESKKLAITSPHKDTVEKLLKSVDV